jgi:hypothetical protein
MHTCNPTTYFALLEEKVILIADGPEETGRLFGTDYKKP